jgi:hypothetical protein
MTVSAQRMRRSRPVLEPSALALRSYGDLINADPPQHLADDDGVIHAEPAQRTKRGHERRDSEARIGLNDERPGLDEQRGARASTRYSMMT